jgi:hypothetical protein
VAHAVRLPGNARSPAKLVDAGASGNGVLWTGPWAVPVSIDPGTDGASTELIVSDAGRAGSAIARLPHGPRRFVIDILGTGDNRPNERLLMMVGTAGHRLLGEQVAQILACARFVADAAARARVPLVAEGQITSFAALVAAALEPGLFASVTVHGDLPSLSLLIESAERFESCPSLFCFGLLEVADVPQLVALLDGVPYLQPSRCVRPARG